MALSLVHQWSSSCDDRDLASPRQGPGPFALEAGEYILQATMPVEISIRLSESPDLWCPVELSKDFGFTVVAAGVFSLRYPLGGKGALSIWRAE